MRISTTGKGPIISSAGIQSVALTVLMGMGYISWWFSIPAIFLLLLSIGLEAGK